MKICLLECRKDTPQTNLPPLGLGYLASFLRKAAKDVHVVYEDDPPKIARYNPDIIGISSITRNFNASIDLARQIRKTCSSPIIIGGVHISAMPESLAECVDAGVIGDGEESFAAIVGSFSSKGRLQTEELHRIPGLAYWENGSVVQTETRRYETQLDKFPFPDRDIFIGKGFIPYRSNMHMVTSRGCPYRCRFCYNRGAWGKYRYFSAHYVVEELRCILERYRPLSIGFIDDLFIANIKRLQEIVRLMCSRGLHRRAYYGGNARANLVNEKTMKLLKAMNMRELFFGFESASDRILSYLNKSGCTRETNQRAIDLCVAHGIPVKGSFIIGTPVETEDDLRETLDFIKKNMRAFMEISFGTLVPLPGTFFWDLAKEKGLIRDNFELTHAMNEKIDDVTYDRYNGYFRMLSRDIFNQRKRYGNRLRRWKNRFYFRFWRIFYALIGRKKI
jgi:radical SAM superfamily enzyme YgiQ (UPF0313 family)